MILDGVSGNDHHHNISVYCICFDTYSKFPELSLELGSQLLMFFVFLHSCPQLFRKYSPTKIPKDQNRKGFEPSNLMTSRHVNQPIQRETPTASENGRCPTVKFWRPGDLGHFMTESQYGCVRYWRHLYVFSVCVFIWLCTMYIYWDVYVVCTHICLLYIYVSRCVSEHMCIQYIMCTSMCTYKNKVMTMSVYVHIYVVCSHALFACPN